MLILKLKLALIIFSILDSFMNVNIDIAEKSLFYIIYIIYGHQWFDLFVCVDWMVTNIW